MVLPEALYSTVKRYLIEKLGAICDADPVVLSDYVLALLKHEKGIGDLRKLCENQLQDFLGQYTRSFVDELFCNFVEKSEESYSRDRKLRYEEESERDQNFKRQRKEHVSDHRSNAEPANRYYGRRDDHDDRRSSHHYSSRHHHEEYDPSSYHRHNDSESNSRYYSREDYGRWNHHSERRRSLSPNVYVAPKKPCVSFRETGYCKWGSQCRYEHIEEGGVSRGDARRFAVERGYTSATVRTSDRYPSSVSFKRESRDFRLREGAFNRPTSPYLGDKYNCYSPARPFAPHIASSRYNYEFSGRTDFRHHSYPRRMVTSYDTIVVENIPGSELSVENIKEYFSRFGSIKRVEVDGVHRRAVLQFGSEEEAHRAHSSPEPVFNNRFVKLYWHRGPEPPAPGLADASQGRGGDKAQQKSFQDFLDVQRKSEALIQRYLGQQKELLDRLSKQSNISQEDKQGILNALSQIEDNIKSQRHFLEASRDKWNAARLGSSLQLSGKSYFNDGGRSHVSSNTQQRANEGSKFEAFRLDNRPDTIAVSGLTPPTAEEIWKCFEKCGECKKVEEDETTLIVHFSNKDHAQKALRESKECAHFANLEISWLKNEN